MSRRGGSFALTVHRWRVAAGFALALVLAVTMVPMGTGHSQDCATCGAWVADGIANIILFVPIGFTFARVMRGPWHVVLFAAALSCCIELTQWSLIPGRDGSAIDVMTNTTGAAIGVAIAIFLPRLIARRTAGAFWTAGVAPMVVVVAVTGILSEPSLPADHWWGQWTPQFGNLAHYYGKVLSVTLGGVAIPSYRLDDNGAARAAFLDGKPFVVIAQSSPPTPDLSAIFSIADDSTQQIFMLGANRSDLDLIVRRRASDIGLFSPAIRMRSALAGVHPSDTITLEARRQGARFCFGVRPDVRCGQGYTVGDGWRFLISIERINRLAWIMSPLWLACLFVPIGMLSPWRSPFVVLAAAGALMLGSLAFGFVTTPASQLIAAALGVVAGFGISRQTPGT